MSEYPEQGTNPWDEPLKAYIDDQDAEKADDDAVVHDTGNETVAGVKTFSSSPIVPAPTTDLQVATKKYVDDNAGGGAVDSVNAQTGVVVLDQDDIADGSTNKQYSQTEKTKLAGIETAADVTDAANVTAAGAFMKASDDTDDITAGATNKFATAAEKSKLGNITVTQAVNLDTMESDIANKQPLDTDLTTIAAMDSSVAGAIATDGAGWLKKTYAQFKTALGLVKADVGLGNVDNTSDANKPVSTAQQTALDAKLDDSQKGVAGGLAELDGSGLVPTAQLPSYVDDVVVVANFAALPGTGETGKIYVTIDTNLTYRWNGSSYTEISASLALGETSSTAYRGDRGKTAYDHSQLTSGNPHQVTKTDVGLSNVDNTTDAAKPVSTAQQTALDGKQTADADLTTIAALDSSTAGALVTDGAGWIRKTYAQLKTALGLVKADVGLGNVQNVDTTTTTNITDATNKRFVTDAQQTVIGNTSGTNTGDQTLPVKATGAEVDTGTNDTKFVTPKAINDSHNVPDVAPGTVGNVMTSDGTDWVSSAAAGGGSATGLDLINTRSELQAQFNTTTLSLFNFVNAVGATTQTAVTMSAGNPSTAYPAVVYETSAGSGQSVQVRMTENSYQRGHSSLTNAAGGFRLFMKFGISTGAAGVRWFAGMTSGQTTIGNVEPSTLTDMFGFGCDAADTNLQIFSNDSSGTATKTDLGANFPRSHYGVSYHYDCLFTCVPNGSILYTVHKYEDTGTVRTATGTISTDLPTQNQGMTPHIWLNNGATAAVVRLRLGRICVDSKLG